MTNTVMACMKDEAIFVLEWVAYHLAIGFDRVAICTNGCTDGTDALVSRLSALAPVTHIDNDDLPEGRAPQLENVARVLAHAELSQSDWILHIDADEFLNIAHGDGLLSDLLPFIAPYDAAAFTWKLFGDSHLAEWPGGYVLENQVQAAGGIKDFTQMQKTMFRPSAFGAGIDHMPKMPLRDVTLCNAMGGRLNAAAFYDPASANHCFAGGERINRKRHIGWNGAWINHYAIRTPDLFLLKNARGDGKKSRHDRRYHFHSRWHRAANANHVEDRSIQRHLPRTREIAEALRADPMIAGIEREAMARLEERRRIYLTEANRSLWTNWSAVDAGRAPAPPWPRVALAEEGEDG